MQAVSSTYTPSRFFLLHALLIPGCLAATAWLSHSSGLDQRIAAFFFDPLAHGFPAHRWEILETLGHRFAKSAVLGLWLLLLAAALAANWVERLRAQAPLLWVTLIAMALGPTIVVLMKALNGYRCPWDLVQFGGIAEYGSGWFVPRLNAGHCFPSGHAAGGFSLIALFFAGYISGHEGIRRWGLVIAVGAGCLFSMVRIAQGAHFLSHNLWSAAIDWVVAALVFTPLAINARADAVEDTFGDASSAALKARVGGLERIWRAAGYSLQGLQAVWRREAAFRQEAIAAAVLLPVALVVPVTAVERCALIATLAFVLVVELLNSAIEAVVDLVSPDHHRLAGLAKDAGSAAVLIALVLTAFVWILVLA